MAHVARPRSRGLESSTVATAGDDSPLERSKTRGSEDARSDTSSHHRRMSRLFKGRGSRKRDKSGSHDDVAHASRDDDVPPVPPVKLPGAGPPNQSTDSLGLARSVASSLLTEDSDSESPSGTRPGISPHQSHTGLLTLSSPLIASETVDSTNTAASTLANSIASAEGLALQHANTVDLAASKKTASPVGKLKEAFTPTRRSTSPRPGAPTDNARPHTSGGGLGSLFGGKKRDTKVLDEPLQLSPPPIRPAEETGQASPTRAKAPKRLVTHIPATPPNLVDAPTTLVTPPTPTDGTSASLIQVTSPNNESDSDSTTGPPGSMITHKRSRSTNSGPSKLSHSTTAPLSPFPEEVKTPGGTAHNPNSPGGSGGFFASIFSVAQSAATNISDTITAPGKSKNNQQPSKEGTKASEEPTEEAVVTSTAEPNGVEKRRPAVETLGSGNLSLAHLGISDSREVSPMTSTTNVTAKAEGNSTGEDMAVAQAVSAAYAADKPASVSGERPRSINAGSGQPAAATASPQRSTDLMESPAPASVQRQGSIRSRISGGRRRRHRGSSVTTAGNMPNGSSTGLVPSGNRLNGTGFAVAPPKRNRDFHSLFKSVPEDDYLIEDYSAALQKEILLHGRLYVSEGHLCFSSNILGWVTNLVISFDEVVSVEKKSTAVLFPNAIVISTLHSRNVFASFLTRDSTYDLIIGIWKISHPNLKSSLNGVALDGSGTGDKTEKAESVGSEDGTLPDSEDDVYDEDEEEDGQESFTDAGGDCAIPVSDTAAAAAAAAGETAKVSGAVAQAVGGGGETVEAAKAATAGAAAGQDFPGPASHGPTECGDNDKHYDKLLIDTTIPAPMGKVYSLMFGPASGVFMRKWLIEDQKSTDLQMEDDKKGLGEDRKTFNYSYIKPLNAPVGPRQTKCNIEMTLEQYDLDKAISVQCSTGTPDVPNGNIFLTKTRYCLMWGPGNSTRLIMTFVVEWSGKSWLKGPIEKGANDGQMSYATSLTTALRTAVSAKIAPLKAGGKGGKSKKRSNTKSMDEAAAPVAPTATSQAKQSNWGLLDPLRSLLGPIADILESIFSPQILIFLLGSLLIYSWFFRGGKGGPLPARGQPHWSVVAHRHAAHEEIWRYEESELWKWLEERVALDRVHHSVASGNSKLPNEDKAEQQQQHFQPETMHEREMDEAIKVTEEKLKALKDAVKRKKANSNSKTNSPKEQTT